MEATTMPYSGHVEVEDRIVPKKKAKSRKKRKMYRGFTLAAVIFFAVSLCFLGAAFVYLEKQGIIPDDLFSKILIGAGLFTAVEILLLIISRNSISVSVLSMLTCLAITAASAFGVYTLYSVFQSVEEVEEPKTFYAQVGVYVRKDSRFITTYTHDEEGALVTIPGDNFDGCKVGTMLMNMDKGYTSNGMRLFRRKNDVSVVTYDQVSSMIDALRNEEIDAIIYNQSYMDIYVADTDFKQWAMENELIGIETQNTSTVRKADVVSEPFIVYIAGIDTYDADNFYDYSRADSNIVACVDPVGKKILLINTPRDYYVPFWGEWYAMDKLTHAGVYGVECSMETLEYLYDIKFNYYVRTNIYSLIRIVDALGGITVHSDYEFYAPNGIGGYQQFYVGDNYVDGAGALCFIRERHSFEDEDQQRGKNQQECIKAIIKKACSPAIVAHFRDVLNVVTECVRTNITQDEINDLIKMQLSDMANWTVETYAVSGSEIYGPSYALGGEEVFLVDPDYDTVETAKKMIREFMRW